MTELCHEERLAVGPYWIFLSSHPVTFIGLGVQWNRHCWASAPLCNGSQFTWMEWHVMIQLLNMHSRCWPKEDWDIQRQCTLKWISKKSMIFRSSLRYRPWGMLVGVSGSFPAKAVALLLGESRAYGHYYLFYQTSIILSSENWRVNKPNKYNNYVLQMIFVVIDIDGLFITMGLMGYWISEARTWNGKIQDHWL